MTTGFDEYLSGFALPFSSYSGGPHSVTANAAKMPNIHTKPMPYHFDTRAGLVDGSVSSLFSDDEDDSDVLLFVLIVLNILVDGVDAFFSQ